MDLRRSRPGETNRWFAIVPMGYLAVTVGIPLLIITTYSFLSRPDLGVGVKWQFTPISYVRIFLVYHH